MDTAALHLADYLIIGAYFAFVIGLGFFLKGRQHSEEDFFLAGRSLLWPVIGFSLFASNMGSVSLIGLAESGYRGGFAVFSYEWMAVVVLVLFAVFFLPFYLKNQLYTIPQFLELRYGPAARTYFSAVTIFLNVFIDIASGLYAGGLILRIVFPGLTLSEIVWLLSAITVLYTLMGGLASVVYSDTVQAILLLAGSVIITARAWMQVGGWDGLSAAVDPTFFTIVRGADDPTLPGPGLFGVFLLGFYFWITNQFIAQRALAAKSVRQGQYGALFAGLLKLLPLFVMVLPGVMGRVLYPELTDAREVYPRMVFDLLPVGLLGLVLAGFMAALMSSIDSGLNAASTLFTFDFYKKYRPKATPAQLVRTGRLMMVVFMGLAVLWAPWIDTFDSFWDYLQMVLSFLCPPIVALFLFGLFSKRPSRIGANAAIATGVGLSVMGVMYKVAVAMHPTWTDVLPHYLYLASFLFFVCTAVLFAVSAWKPDPAGSRDWNLLLWTPAYFREELQALKGVPFYKNYLVLSAGLLLLVVALLLIF